MFKTNIPITTNMRPPINLRVKYSPFTNKADKVAPNTGMNKRYMLISPSLLYFSKVYHNTKAVADTKDKYIKIAKLVPLKAKFCPFIPILPTSNRNIDPVNIWPPVRIKGFIFLETDLTRMLAKVFAKAENNRKPSPNK